MADLADEAGLADQEIKDSKPLDVKYCRLARETPGLTGELIGIWD